MKTFALRIDGGLGSIAPTSSATTNEAVAADESAQSYHPDKFVGGWREFRHAD
jgi:hypothetical protein